MIILKEGLTALLPEGEASKINPGGYRLLVFFVLSPFKANALWAKNKKSQVLQPGIFFGGERGIRTPGPVTVNSFQDCRIRPLCHFSAAKVVIRFSNYKTISDFFSRDAR